MSPPSGPAQRPEPPDPSESSEPAEPSTPAEPLPEQDRSRRPLGPARRVGAVAALFLAGLVLGVVGAFVQADRLILGSVPLPWGTLLMLVALVVLVRGASWLVSTRWGGAAVAVGWLVATVALATTSPSGDLAISAGGRQLAYLFGGVVVATASVTVPLVERRPRPGR